MPKFSVIIPVYKVEKYIRQCIESVLNQTFTDFEILAVDDCGYDNSINIVEEYAKKDARIKILYHDKNLGLAAARNTALDAAIGKYIVCLDSDDWMEKDCLSIIYSEFQKRKTESIWFNAYSYYEETKSRGEKPMYEQSDGFRTLTQNTIAAYADFTWIKAYTRESIQKYNLHWPVGLTFEDGEFYFKYFTLHPKTYVISDCLINYRYREGSIVRDANKGKVKMEDIYTVVLHLKDFWTKLGLYEVYKTTIIKLIQNRIRMMRGLNYSDANKKMAYEFMKKMGFPEAFESLHSEDVCYENNPLVSVVVPVYNVEEYVAECLDSIINQTYKNLEIICVDDCGEDNSIKIVKKYAKKDKRIKIIRHRRNKGLGGARNTGLENAKGKYIFFFDSDDYLELDCISAVVKKLIETNLNVVFYKADVYYQGAKKRDKIWYTNYANYPEGHITMDTNNICSIPCQTWNKGFKRQFLIDNNIRWRENVIYEDIDVSFRIFTKSPCTYMMDRVLYVYRIRNGSIINECYKNLTHAEDLYKALQSTHDYLVESGLMEKYKKGFLELVMLNINNYRNTPSTHKKLLPLMVECLKNIGFPNEYEQKELEGCSA